MLPTPSQTWSSSKKEKPQLPLATASQRGASLGSLRAGSSGLGLSGVFPAAVMRFMGDAPLKGQRERDVLCTLLKVSLPTLLCALPCSVTQFPHWQPELQDFGLGSFQCGPRRSASARGRDWRGT